MHDLTYTLALIVGTLRGRPYESTYCSPHSSQLINLEIDFRLTYVAEDRDQNLI